MWKVTLPDNGNAINDLDTALTYQNGIPKYRITDTERDQINALYTKYEEQQGVADVSLEASTLKSETLQAIHDAYNEVQDKGRLSYLRSKILLSTPRCPCCGISAADELDHHLPRSKFKGLAVYSSNLVPLCHKCNNKKRTVSGENPEKRFVHVYYDDIPTDVQFLKADLTVVNSRLVIDYKIEKVKGLDELLFKQLTFQAQRVDLNNRLNKETNVFLSSIAPSLFVAYGGNNNAEAVKNILLLHSQYHQNIFGLNDWRTALLTSLSTCNGFYEGGFIKILGLESFHHLSTV